VTGAGREFGDPLTLEQARSRLDGKLVLPGARGFDEPEEIYTLDRSYGDENSRGVAMVYPQRTSMPSLGGTGAGLILIEIPGDLSSMYPGSELARSSGAEKVEIGGGRGYWITGGGKLPYPLDLGVHPPANVLIWEREGLVLRLAADLPRAEAIKLAESMRQ
jgi:hypothetical protein